MGDILEISAPSHRNQLCNGISRLFDSEVGCDFELLCADSTPIKAHFFVLQIFCHVLQISNYRRIEFESTKITREDVRCLLAFVYRGKTRIKVERLDAVKRAAVKLGMETFLDLVEGIQLESVEVDVENETDTENEEEVGDSLAEVEDNLDEDSSDRDYTECSEEEEKEQKITFAKNARQNVGNHEKNGDIGNPLRKRSTHSKERHHACKTCCKYFQTAKSLRRHEMTSLVHSEKVDCEICGKKFSLRSITRHQKLHKIEGSVKKFKCTICAYRSIERFNLKKHMKNVHHMSESKIARFVYSEATRVLDEDPPQDLGKLRRCFKGRKNNPPKR